MSDYFSFHKLITNTIVKTVYFVGFLAISVGAIALIVWAGMQLHDANIARQMGWRYVAIGAAALVIGNIAWRVICEFWIVLFSINEHLAGIDYPLGPIRNVQGTQFVERRVITKDNRVGSKEAEVPSLAEAPKPEKERFRQHHPASSVLGLS
jgi:hypothetical protein